MRVEWSEDAVDELDRILAYIAESNPTAVAMVADRVDRATRTIARFPRVARLDQVSGTREYIVRGLPLLIIYREGEDRVDIVAIFHTSRDPHGKPYA